MDIRKYATFFHDGTVHDIRHDSEELILFIESAEMLPEWNADHIPLSKRSTICGQLHAKKPISIRINTELFLGVLKMEYDDGEIYRLRYNENKILLKVSWANYPPKIREETDVFVMEIEAKDIYWENRPPAYDSKWE